ncbi:pseudouridine synthase [Shewanella atlantica]|uniref:pseudouridine synthase n=1 Tax=Shewanella atlantica TaxID=271099 RepID=UPI0037370695
MRLDKFLCKSTELTRSEAVASIEAAEVSVNGEVVTDSAVQVHENNNITLNGQVLTARASRYIMVHKPLNTLSSNVDGDYPSVMNCLDMEKVCDLHIAGRLDADTTGLVLITDDGRWSFNIINPKYHCEKVYRVSLRDPITADIAQKFARGMQLQGEASLTRPAKLEELEPKEVLLTITEGRYHQVKRMFAAVGNRVNALHRQQIGDVTLDIDVGRWRHLTAAEINSFSDN